MPFEAALSVAHMHFATLRQTLSITFTALFTGTLALVTIDHDAAATAAPAAIAAVSTTAAAPAPAAPTTATHAASTPQRIFGGVADVLVRIGGGAPCSGTPVAGTAFVATAAHCVLDRDGNVESRTVTRDGVEYRASAVLVNLRYHNTPVAELDAAVLVLDRPIPGPSATLAAALPATGQVTLAGFQPLDTDGSLLRGTNPHNLPVPNLASRSDGDVVTFDVAAAGCDNDIASVTITPAWTDVPCGLIPGASGGGLFATHGDAIELLGIVSWVSADITHNGVTPIDSLLELLEHQAEYIHIPVPHAYPVATAHVTKS